MASHGRAHSRALYETFVRPLLRPNAAHNASPSTILLPRLFSTTSVNSRFPSRPSRTPKTATKTFVNDSIPARYVRIVSQETNEVSAPMPLSQALDNIDRNVDRVLCLSKPPHYLSPGDPDYEALSSDYDYVVRQYKKFKERYGDPNAAAKKDPLVALQDGFEDEVADGDEAAALRRVPAIYMPRGGYIRTAEGDEWIPLCRVEDIAGAEDRAKAAERAKKERKKLSPAGVKVIELNWAIAPGDLGHRLKKIEELLGGRKRVEILIAHKKKKKKGMKSSVEQAEALVKKVREIIHQVPGAKEARPMQGEVGDVVSLMLEGAMRGKADEPAS